MGVPWRLRSYQEKQAVSKTIRFILILLLSLLIGYQVLVSFIGKSYIMHNQTMAPTIEPGDYFIINPIYKWLPGGPVAHPPKRGEIVLIGTRDKERHGFFARLLEPFIRLFTLQKVGFKTAKEKLGMPSIILKRVIALPGDWVKGENGTIYVRPRGTMYYVTEFEASSQIYETKPSAVSHQWSGTTRYSANFPEFQLGKNEVFVLGDNREQINDSRIFGPLALSQIYGQVEYIYWPISKLNKIEQRKSNK